MTGAETYRPLIISGAPRSGTSLLYNLFDGHPDIFFLVTEGYLFEYAHDLGPDYHRLLARAARGDVDRLIAGLRDRDVMPPLHRAYEQSRQLGSVDAVRIEIPWDEDAFRATLETPPASDSLGAFWHWLAAAYAAAMDMAPRPWACMKAPDYAKSALAATTHIAEARALVIVRDPLRALDSLKRSREMRGVKQLSWPLLAESVAAFNRMADRVAGADPARLRWIRYEALIADPEPAIADLADWLGLPFHPALRAPTMLGRDWPGISSFATTDGIDARAGSRALGALDEAEIAFITENLDRFDAVFGETRPARARA